MELLVLILTFTFGFIIGAALQLSRASAPQVTPGLTGLSKVRDAASRVAAHTTGSDRPAVTLSYHDCWDISSRMQDEYDQSRRRLDDEKQMNFIRAFCKHLRFDGHQWVVTDKDVLQYAGVEIPPGVMRED